MTAVRTNKGIELKDFVTPAVIEDSNPESDSSSSQANFSKPFDYSPYVMSGFILGATASQEVSFCPF